jgi:hypothetical protein
VTATSDGLEEFRRRHGFEDWRGARASDGELFVWGFFFGGQELPGRRALRIDTVDAPGWPPAVQSLWGVEKDESAPGEEPLVRIDVYECTSRAEAHELVVRLLAEFQSPLIERRRNGLGDVAFGMPGDRSLVLARANAAVIVRNAGTEIQAVEPVADEIDKLFAAPLDLDRSTVRPEIRRVALAEGKPTRAVPIELMIEAEDPLGRRVWFRLSAKGGEFSSRDGRVFYAPEVEGAQAVKVAAINENLGVATQTLEFEV